MPYYALLALLVLVSPLSVSAATTDAYLELGGVEGESTPSATSGTTTVQVAPVIAIPVASTESLSGRVGASVVLDGSRSADDGVIKSFSWRQTAGPTVRLTNGTTLKPSFTPSVAGTYQFELTVVDATGLSSVAKKIKIAVADEAKPTAASSGTVLPPPPAPQEASADFILKTPPIEGEAKKGDVDMNWKVEEGEKAPGVEPDEIDARADSQPITPDFSILLGGGGGDAEQKEKTRMQIADIVLKGAVEEGAPVEQVSLNFEKIKMKTKQNVKLFGIFPVAMSATVEIDANGGASVSLPWWSFLASGKNASGLGQQTKELLITVLKKNKAQTDGLLLIRY